MKYVTAIEKSRNTKHIYHCNNDDQQELVMNNIRKIPEYTQVRRSEGAKKPIYPLGKYRIEIHTEETDPRIYMLRGDSPRLDIAMEYLAQALWEYGVTNIRAEIYVKGLSQEGLKMLGNCLPRSITTDLRVRMYTSDKAEYNIYREADN